MRGSPLLRTLLLACGLLLAGWGMLRFASVSAEPQTVIKGQGRVEKAQDYGFSITLSAAVKSLELKGRDGRVLFRGGGNDPLNGTLGLDPADPVIFVTVAWKETTGTDHRFVKLTLEPPGKPTLVHYFEAPGDFEDVWELPLK